MTREEAIDILVGVIKTQKAINMAIKALEQEQNKKADGTWIEKNSHTYICDECGFEQAIYFNMRDYRFCPRCGIKMEWVEGDTLIRMDRLCPKCGEYMTWYMRSKEPYWKCACGYDTGDKTERRTENEENK